MCSDVAVGFVAAGLDATEVVGGLDGVVCVGAVFVDVFVAPLVVATFVLGFFELDGGTGFAAGVGAGIFMPGMLPMDFIESAWAIESRFAFDA